MVQAQTLSMLHKVRRTGEPESLAAQFCTNAERHDHRRSTRQDHLLSLPRIGTWLGGGEEAVCIPRGRRVQQPTARVCQYVCVCLCKQTSTASVRSDVIGLHDGVLTRHRLGYWRTLECLGEGGGADHAPLLSREPLVVESRATRHSKALHKTHRNHLSELNIEVKCEVKVRSKVKIWRFDVLGPGDQDYGT